MLNEKRCVLVVDDEEKITRAIKDFLKINGFEVLCATNGKIALDVFYDNSTKVDMILLDVMMPIIDGYSVLKEIRQSSLVPVIMLTAKGEEYDQLKGFESGADDYIVKPFSPTLMLARIEAVLKRFGKDITNDLIAGEIKLSVIKRTAYLNDIELELTRREFDLLCYFILNKGLTLSREQILNGVWGYDYDGDIRTVDTHIKQLRIKLLDKAEYINTIHRVGYRFEV